MGKARVIGYIFVCVNISTEKNLPLCSAMNAPIICIHYVWKNVDESSCLILL